MRGDVNRVRLLDVQAALIQPSVLLASSHLIGDRFAITIVLDVLPAAIETMDVLLDALHPSITTLTIQVRKDMNAFGASANVKLVIMMHTVLRVKTTSGDKSVFIAVITALVPAIRITDALIIANLVITVNE